VHKSLAILIAGLLCLYQHFCSWNMARECNDSGKMIHWEKRTHAKLARPCSSTSGTVFIFVFPRGALCHQTSTRFACCDKSYEGNDFAHTLHKSWGSLLVSLHQQEIPSDDDEDVSLPSLPTANLFPIKRNNIFFYWSLKKKAKVFTGASYWRKQ